jgi:hypothetical protein
MELLGHVLLQWHKDSTSKKEKSSQERNIPLYQHVGSTPPPTLIEELAND